MNQVGKLLIIFGVVFIVVGVLLTVAGKFPFLDKIGRLPGDIIIRREHFTFYFPWVTCLLIILIFFILFNLFRR